MCVNTGVAAPGGTFLIFTLVPFFADFSCATDHDAEKKDVLVPLTNSLYVKRPAG